mmetsp:Transcript_42711/g.43469  ORF Transcript_42711/g.43469 Transcript_42711/m.43469 type:complete len:87 (+) Transcript_42711:1314-1574(+)
MADASMALLVLSLEMMRDISAKHHFFHFLLHFSASTTPTTSVDRKTKEQEEDKYNHCFLYSSHTVISSLLYNDNYEQHHWLCLLLS